MVRRRMLLPKLRGALRSVALRSDVATAPSWSTRQNLRPPQAQSQLRDPRSRSARRKGSLVLARRRVSDCRPQSRQNRMCRQSLVEHRETMLLSCLPLPLTSRRAFRSLKAKGSNARRAAPQARSRSIIGLARTSRQHHHDVRSCEATAGQSRNHHRQPGRPRHASGPQ